VNRSLFIPLAALLAVLAVTTYLQGVATERWGREKTERLQKLATNVNERIPMEIGEWIATEHEVDKEQYKASNCEAARALTFENRTSGEEIDVFVVAGTARNVTIHTPDWCYRGAGYEMENEKNEFIMECPGLPQPPEFLTATFKKEEPSQITRLRIFWTFSDDGSWHGPRQEKVTFAGRKSLAKVYLITRIPLQGDELEENATFSFVKDFMPVLNAALFENLDESPAPAAAKPEA
jgi:hypothetical protein